MHFMMQVDANLEKHILTIEALTAMLVSFLYVNVYKSRNKLSAISSCSCFFSGMSSR